MNTLDLCILQWNGINKRVEKFLETIPEENFYKAIVPGGNSPSWILGHLVEADDALLELLGVGKRLYPELKDIYHHERDNNQTGHLSRKDILEKWKSIQIHFDKAFKTWSEQDWLNRHTVVSEEDFKKEPHRNKLNVVLSRIVHKATHVGQLSMQK